MCGISGVFNLRESGISLNKLQSMNDLVVHRGPDDQGIVLFAEDGNVNIISNETHFRHDRKYCAVFLHS